MPMSNRKEDEIPCIVRLNAETVPMSSEERHIMASIEHRLVEVEGGSDEEVFAAVRDADAIMIVSSYLRTHVIEGLTRCKVISRMGTGVDKIDIDAATRRGIIVNNLPDVFTNEVADHTLALLLAAARQLKFLDSSIRDGRRPHDLMGIHRLASQTVGIIGFGLIGQAVAKRCKAFGLRVLANDPLMTQEDAERHGVAIADLDSILEQSDYLCPLCPLLPQTRKMLAMPQFRKMKPGAALINTGRGGLTDESDLATALKEGVIRYAGLDVFEFIDVFGNEGFATDHDLFKLSNVLLTPHFGANSQEAAMDCRLRSAIAVRDVLAGKWPEHPVNPGVRPWFQSQ